ALSAEFTIGEGELMAHDVPLGCAPDEYDDLISGTCSHLPYHLSNDIISSYMIFSGRKSLFKILCKCLFFKVTVRTVTDYPF
ncbi:hypothetical protein, partial [Escherichia coli]|uniref:hypothetical protein n=1 Tax=Escherichia coli TaxID=562 RepID=UPI001BC8CEF5